MRFSAILRTLVQFLLYALQRNFTHLGTIFILCASTRLLFYAPWCNFTHPGTIFILCASAQFYAKAIFVIGWLLPR